MIAPIPFSRVPTVPNRHVEPVSAIARVEMDAAGRREDGSRAGSAKAAAGTRRGDWADAASAGFSAHLLVEAGDAGHDPNRAERAARAYRTAEARTRLRLTAGTFQRVHLSHETSPCDQIGVKPVTAPLRKPIAGLSFTTRPGPL